MKKYEKLHHSMKTGSQSSPNSNEELRKELEQEIEWLHMQKKSKKQWEDIVSDMSRVDDEIDEDDSEWKTRFYFQTLYNDMLRQQALDMRSEVRMFKHGEWSLRRGCDMDKMSDAECKMHIKRLEKEVKSLEGLCNTYERQLDLESMAYDKAHREGEEIINDVLFQQKTRIFEQDKIDKLIKLKTENKRRALPTKKYANPAKLPPIKHVPTSERKTSYSKMFNASRPQRKLPEIKQNKKRVHFRLETDWIENDGRGHYSNT